MLRKKIPKAIFVVLPRQNRECCTNIISQQAISI